MPINAPFEINGYRIVVSTISSQFFSSELNVFIDISDEATRNAVKSRDSKYLDALEKLCDDHDEILSVLLAEESFNFWFQTVFAKNRYEGLDRLLKSQYSSDKLKKQVKIELGLLPRPEEPKVEESSRKIRKGLIYLVRANTGEYKIGYSVDVVSRLKAFSVQPPFKYELIHNFPSDDMEIAEAKLHHKYEEKHIRGEWFQLNESEVEWIMSIVDFRNQEFIFK